MIEEKITRVEDFDEWVRELEGRNILYRGHADHSWKLSASGFRRLVASRLVTGAMPITFQNYITRLVNETRMGELDIKDGRRMSDLALLGELQHFGAATCLIGFTQNPYIALWFACHEQHQKDGAVIAMRTDDPDKFSEITDENQPNGNIEEFLRRDKIWKWVSPNQNNRIVAQSSTFIFGPGKIEKGLYSRIQIDALSKKRIIEYLRDKLGIVENISVSDFAGFAMANAPDKKYTNYSAEEYFDLGKRHQARGKYKEAKTNYDQAIAIDPQNALSYLNRGYAKAKLGHYAEAIKDYDQAIAIDPQNASTYLKRGQAKAKLGHHAEAMKDYDQAIAINPRYPSAYLKRGYAKEKLGHHAEAMKDYDQAIAINPQKALAYLNRGHAKEKLGHHVEAIKDYDQVIAINPRDVMVYLARGNTKAKLGHYAEAKQDFDKAIAINPQLAGAYKNRGMAKEKTGDIAGAQEDFAMCEKLTSQQ